MSDALARLNTLDEAEALAELTRCCGSTRWAQRMASRRPFATVDAVLQAADEAWRDLDRTDRLEAFAHHPRIGGDTVHERFATTRSWSETEQSGVGDADESLRRRLVEGNDTYFERFGHVFLICATGRRAVEMADELDRRLGNDPETELEEAAEQQRLITRLRLVKLLGS